MNHLSLSFGQWWILLTDRKKKETGLNFYYFIFETQEIYGGHLGEITFLWELST